MDDCDTDSCCYDVYELRAQTISGRKLYNLFLIVS